MDARAILSDAMDLAKGAIRQIDTILIAQRGLTRRAVTTAADALTEAADMLREIGGGDPPAAA